MHFSRSSPTRMTIVALILVTVPLTFILAACAGAQTEPPQVRSAAGEPQVYMCGRSVMAGWFSHWGGEDVIVGGYELIHRWASSLPGSIDDVKSVADSIPAGANAALFYKLCFVDFEGGAANLARNKADADQVLDYVVNVKHQKLIIGNALPKSQGSTDGALVSNHQQYNAYVAALAAAHPGQVWVFDLYGNLTVAGGWLNPAYDTGDGHPNNAGYNALDGPYMTLLGSVFPSGPPAISSISPGTGGLTAPVTINGTSFGGSQGSSRVTFGSADTGQAVAWSDNRIVTCVPVGLAAGPFVVTVTTAGGSDTISFTVNDTAVNERYFAEGFTGYGFAEWLSVGNFGGANAGFILHYMTPDGTVRIFNHTVPATSRASVNVNGEVGADQQVSVVIYSAASLLAERPMYFDYAGRTGGHDTIGAAAPATAWYFAEGYTGPGFDEYVCVLNPQATAATLGFRFQTQEEGEKYFGGIGVPAHTRSSFRINDMLGGGYQASLALSSDIPVVAERPMYFNYGGLTGGSCVTGATALGTEYYFAEGTTRDGFSEYLTLQNPGASPIDIAATYQFGQGQGAPFAESYRVGAASRVTIPVFFRVGAGKDVSVKLSCGSPFAAERPMYFNYGGWTGGSCVIGASAASNRWSFAEGCTRAGFAEYLTLQNPGDTTSSVQVTYLTQEAGALAPRTVNIPAHSRITLLVNEHAGQGYQLSVWMAVTSGPAIVAERPMYFNYNGWDGGHDVVGFPV